MPLTCCLNNVVSEIDGNSELKLLGYRATPCQNLANRPSTMFFDHCKITQEEAIFVKKTTMLGDVRQLVSVNEQIWALMSDHIMVVDSDGSVCQILCPGFSAAQDMCVTGTGHVAVATLDNGLLLVTQAGKCFKGIFW